MKKSLVVIFVIVFIVGVIAGYTVSSYNRFVSRQEAVNTAKSNVSVQLQRRADLIPNFVATVKGYSDYEQSTLTAVTEARASVGKAQTVSEVEQASSELDRAISVWVNAVTEAYPDLKANANYVALQDELAGTENRIATARKDYNDTAKEYNLKVRSFPSNIIASIFGFDRAELFEADTNAMQSPVVTFE
ncbi:MAG: LemA family protein [Clostridia bacterium]|nr:LemA family protein [Clostridia bacterium]